MRGDAKAALIAAAALLIVVLVLGSLVKHDAGGALDARILLAARGLMPDKVAVAITALGSGTVLTIMVAVAAGAMLAVGTWRHALLLVVTALSGGAVENALKHVFERARPTIVEHLVYIDSASFPSAHSANSAMVYLTIATLATRLAAPRALRRYAVAAALLLTALIGTSRVVLGVHWPSDVLAGWLFGSAWALIAYAVAERVAPRGRAA